MMTTLPLPTLSAGDGMTTAFVAAMVGAGVHDPRHAARVVALTDAVCERLGTADHLRDQARLVATLHDLGKLGVPREILHKDTPLTAEERRVLCQQPTIGADMVRSLPGLAEIAPLIEATHERWDGLGYPVGLAGDDIPLVSRIVFVCNAYVTMLEDRPYRPAMPREFALEVVERSVAKQFCPRATAALLAVERPMLAPLVAVDPGVRPSPAPATRPAPAPATAHVPAAPTSAAASVAAPPTAASGPTLAARAAPADAGIASIEEVRAALERQRAGRVEADREARRQSEAQLAKIPFSLWVFLVLAGTVLGVLMALPLPSAKHLCGAASQGGVGCEWDKIWIPAAQTVIVIPVVLILLTLLAIRIPRWWRRWRTGDLEVRTKLVVAETDDPVLAAASWGLVMRDARAAPKDSAKPSVRVTHTGAEAFIQASKASQSRRAA